MTMMCTPAETPHMPPPGVRLRCAAAYRVGGDLRFLSHHDEMRMLTRALVRAGWPLAYSQGFNPQPRLSIVLPRAVGVASDAQLAVIGVQREPDGDALAGQLPDGCTLAGVYFPLAATPHPRRATYEIPLAAEDAATARAARPEVLAATQWPITRARGPGKRDRQLDIRASIEHVDLAGDVLRIGLRHDVQPTARPGEVLEILGVSLTRYRHLIHLREVEWDCDLAGGRQRPPKERGQNIGNEFEDDEDQAHEKDA